MNALAVKFFEIQRLITKSNACTEGLETTLQDLQWVFKFKSSFTANALFLL